MKIEIKIGRRVFEVSEKDLVLDNGSCAQLITQTYSKEGRIFYPVLSKKLSRDLKMLGFLFTNDALTAYIRQHGYSDDCKLYRFDIHEMARCGYTKTEEK